MSCNIDTVFQSMSFSIILHMYPIVLSKSISLASDMTHRLNYLVSYRFSRSFMMTCISFNTSQQITSVNNLYLRRGVTVQFLLLYFHTLFSGFFAPPLCVGFHFIALGIKDTCACLSLYLGLQRTPSLWGHSSIFCLVPKGPQLEL